jgi:Tol biopolymer transport system component
LTWVDRRGTAIGPAGPPGNYGDIELSLDGRYVTYEAGGPAADIWVLDIANGVNSRVTANPTRDADPVWSPDGKTIAFRGDRDGGHLYRRSFGQVGDDQLLLPGADRDSPSSWSTDGRYLLFDRNRGNDIWALPMGASAKPIQLTASTFVEHEGQISPDGRLIAFESNESGAFEIYVQSFPEPGMKRQISSGGAHTARWSPDGKELFYVGPRQTMTVVPITTNGASFSVGAASPLFSMPALVAAEGGYAVSKTGRFLVNVTQLSASNSQITVMMNWASRLTK